MASEGHQEHPLSIYLWIWVLLFVISTLSYLVDYIGFEGYLRWSLIIVFMLANALSYDRKLKERYIQNNYQHDTFRQQLPIPILLKAYNQKNNIKFFFIDNAFRDSISKIDIRLYLQKISSTNIQIDKNNNIEIYNVLLEDIFNYFNISYIKENIDLYASFHFIPYTYGYCQDTKTIDVNYCLDHFLSCQTLSFSLMTLCTFI